MPQKQTKTWWILFAVYAIAMLSLLFGRKEASDILPYAQQVAMRLNLVPFQTLRHQLRLLGATSRPWLIRHAAVNLSGNVLLFIPLGIFLPRLFCGLRRFWKVLAVSAGIIVLVETAQVLTLLGRGDVDDLILNLLGAALGYGLYRWAFRE